MDIVMYDMCRVSQISVPGSPIPKKLIKTDKKIYESFVESNETNKYGSNNIKFLNK